MDSMLSAIKARRSGQKMGAAQPAPAQGGGQADMQGLVAALSPEQKQELMALLSQESQEQGGGDIEVGAASSDEEQAIQQRMQEQAGEPGLEEGGEESDEIAKSMLDRNSLEKAESGAKPRNLGDRARMAMAKKLKGKGKI